MTVSMDNSYPRWIRNSSRYYFISFLINKVFSAKEFNRAYYSKLVLGRLIGSSLVESFTNSYTLTDPNGTEEKYT